MSLTLQTQHLLLPPRSGKAQTIPKSGPKEVLKRVRYGTQKTRPITHLGATNNSINGIADKVTDIVRPGFVPRPIAKAIIVTLGAGFVWSLVQKVISSASCEVVVRMQLATIYAERLLLVLWRKTSGAIVCNACIIWLKISE